MNTLDIKYIAGLLDGEGFVGVTKNAYPLKNGLQSTMSYVCSVRIKMKELPENSAVLEQIRDQLGGAIHHYRGIYKSGKCVNRYVEWYVTGRKARALASILQPHCIIKKKELDVLIEFSAHVNHGGKGNSKANEKEVLYLLSRSLKNANRISPIRVSVFDMVTTSEQINICATAMPLCQKTLF